MTEQIEVDPPLAAAPFGAAEQFAVELARRDEVVHRHRQMEPGTQLTGRWNTGGLTRVVDLVRHSGST